MVRKARKEDLQSCRNLSLVNMNSETSRGVKLCSSTATFRCSPGWPWIEKEEHCVAGDREDMWVQVSEQTQNTKVPVPGAQAHKSACTMKRRLTAEKEK